MGELKIYVEEGLEERFRKIAMTVFGYGRGSLSKAAAEALTKWCQEKESVQASSTKPDARPVEEEARSDKSELVHDTDNIVGPVQKDPISSPSV